jgi:hypothetical protein
MKTTVEIPDILLDERAALSPESQVLLTLLRAWLSRPESRRLVSTAADAIQDDLAILLYTTDLRLPETAQERRNGFSRWLNHQLESLEPCRELGALDGAACGRGSGRAWLKAPLGRPSVPGRSGARRGPASA